MGAFSTGRGQSKCADARHRTGRCRFPDVRLIPLRKTLDKFLALGSSSRSHNFLISGIAPAQPDILHDSLIKEHDILEYNGIILEQRFRFYRFDIHAAQGNGSGVRIPKRAASLEAVDLPLPDGPTSAVTSPCFATKDTPFKTGSSL